MTQEATALSYALQKKEMADKFNRSPYKSRFESLGDIWTDGSGQIFIGKDMCLQNDILDNKEETKSRSCYRECRTCGCCANSMRDGSSCVSSFDQNAGKMIACSSCEKFRFCDCRNGFFRDAHGDAEPFTEEVYKTLKETSGRPLI